MSVFFTYQPSADNKCLVLWQNFEPENLTQDIIDTGVLVDSIPAPEQQAGKDPVLYYNPTDKTFSYDYVDIPPSTDDKVKALESQNAQILLALVNGGLI